MSNRELQAAMAKSTYTRAHIETLRTKYLNKLRKQGLPEKQVQARLRGWDSVDKARQIKQRG